MPGPMKTRVCIISTLHHNVGDDFVREGILWLLRRAAPEVDFEVRAVHKHCPITARGAPWDDLDRATRRWPRVNRLLSLLDRLPLNRHADAVLGADLVIQSGAPVYWNNRFSKCARTEWFGPLIERRWARMNPRVPLMNLGAGSCLAAGSDGSEISGDAECRAFVRRFCELASLTTVRDPLALRIVRDCGGDATLLPCPSIFAARSAGIAPMREGHVALNYMRGAGHYDLAGAGPGVIAEWEAVFTRQARRLAKDHACVLVCHDARELAEARRLLPEIPSFFSSDWRDYLKIYSGCRAALLNRVHGAMVAAAAGAPVVLVGNDTRLLTAGPMRGIRALSMPASEDDIGWSIDAALARGRDSEAETFLDANEAAYTDLLRRSKAAQPARLPSGNHE